MAKKEKKPKKEEVFDLEKFLKKELRRAFKRSPLYNQAKAKAKCEYFEESKHGKLMRRVHFRCAECGRFFRDEERNIAIDHFEPVESPEHGWQGIETYIKRLFCSLDNLNVLCNYPLKKVEDGTYEQPSCHHLKSQRESEIRKLNRKKKLKE